MAAKQFTFAFIVSLVILYCCKASLLQETIAKSGLKAENDEEIKVEIVNDDKENEADTKSKKEANSDDQNKDTNENEESNKDENSEPDAMIHLKTIFKPTVCDNVTKSGKVAVLHYTGWVGDKKFDSTIDPLKRYIPFEFIIGTGAVIKGFEQGMKDMCKGEQRKITIPPELGYGIKGAGLIPGSNMIIVCTG